MTDRKKLTQIERDLIEGLESLAGDLKGDAPLPDKYTCRRLVLDLRPQTYKPKDVVATRTLLKASQALFAQFLGVSPKTVRSWEQGKTPSDMACRFMDEIRRDPDYWVKRLHQAAKVKKRKPQRVA
jgi:putative transcriptional regulator